MRAQESVIKKIWRVIYPALLLVVIYLVVYFIAMVVYDTFFSAEFSGFDAFTTVAGEYISIACMAAGIFLGWIFYRKDDAGFSEVLLKKPVFFIFLVIFGALASRALSIGTSFAGMVILPDAEYTQASSMVEGLGLIVALLRAAIFAPIAEELIFRGLIFKRLYGYTNFWPAALVSSFIFSLFHTNTLQMIYTFAFGLVICLVYRIFDNLWAPIAVHAGANALSLVLEALKVQYDSEILYAVIMIVTAGVAVLIYWLGFGRFRKINQKDED